MVVVALELGVLLRAHLFKSAVPEVAAVGEYIPFVDKRDRFFRVFLVLRVALPLQLEGILEAAVYSAAVVHHQLRGDLLARAHARCAAVARVNAAGVLADDDEIDVLGALVLERGLHVRIELHRPEIDVLVQGKAYLEQDAGLEDARFYVGMADSAQEHGVELFEFVDRAVRKRLAGLQIPRAAEVELGELKHEPALCGGGFQDLYSLPNHFRPGPVTGDRCDLIGFGHYSEILL